MLRLEDKAAQETKVELPLFEVSVIVAAYDVSAYIDRALRSAAAQTVPNIEIIVVDDASLDDTAERVARYAAADLRIRLIRQERNGGPARARNIALRAARGRWIAVLDADDAWAPARLRRLLDASTGCDLVFDNLMGFDLHAGRCTGPLFPHLPSAGLALDDLLAPEAPGTSYDFGYLQPLMRTEFLRNHRIAYVPELRAGEDLVLGVTALLAGARTATVPEPHYIYTTRVGAESGRVSMASKTVPGASPVHRILSELLAEHGDALCARTRAAFQDRLDHIAANSVAARFQHARRRRHYADMARMLATEPALRRHAWRRLRRGYAALVGSRRLPALRHAGRSVEKPS